MAVLQDLLRRLGFVKLGRYGLTLTADDRVVSQRPAVLDNGAGQRVVGWRDDDLAMAELAPWQPALDGAQPAARRAQFSATQPPRLPGVGAPRFAAVLPVAQPVIPQPSSPPPVGVAPEGAVEEDDWEWSIALARARAAADEATAPLAPRTKAASTPPPPMPGPAPVMPGPLTYAQPALGAPATVIPVPRLPSIRDAERAGRFEPVVRTTIGPAPAPPPGRLASGTAPIGPDTEQTPAVLPDDTEQTFSIGDRTTPGVAMPLVARAVALPRIKGGSARRG